MRCLLLLVLGLLLLAASGCSIRGERVETGTGAADPSALAATFDAAANGTEDGSIESVGVARPDIVDAFAFTATELFSGAPARGQDLVDYGSLVMTFVSPTCEFSTQDAVAFADAADANPEVGFVFVHTGGDAASYEAWVENAELFQENVVHLDDSDAKLTARFGVTSQPSSVLLGSSEVVTKTVGALGHEGLANVVEYLG